MAKLKPASKERMLGIDLAESQLTLVMQLVAMRKAKNLSQDDVARRIGVDRSVVSKFENSINSDKQPQLSTIKRYAEAVEAFVAHFVTDGTIDHGEHKAYEPTLRALRKNLNVISHKTASSEEEMTYHEFRVALRESASTFTGTLSFTDPPSRIKPPGKARGRSRQFLVREAKSVSKITTPPSWTESSTWRAPSISKSLATEEVEACQM